MSKHRVLSFKPQFRLEWRGQDGQNETEQPDHSASLGDSITTRIRFSVHTGGAPIGVMVTNSKSVNNAFGIRSLGPNVTVRVGDSTITGNNTGLTFAGGGALLTYGTNKVQANGVDGAFSGPVGLQ
jgi:hypothetical protein